MTANDRSVAAFQLDLDRFKDRIPFDQDAAVRRLVRRLVLDMVGATPIATGRHAASWVVSVGTPDNSRVRFRQGERFTRSQALARAEAEIAKAAPGSGFLGIWIVNNGEAILSAEVNGPEIARNAVDAVTSALQAGLEIGE